LNAAIAATMPHSLEAEKYLLSCCVLDGADTVSHCLEAGIRPDWFYLAAHGIIFERLQDLYKRQKPIDASVLADELKAARQLDEILVAEFQRPHRPDTSLSRSFRITSCVRSSKHASALPKMCEAQRTQVM
jgi:replicative DNA helicase